MSERHSRVSLASIKLTLIEKYYNTNMSDIQKQNEKLADEKEIAEAQEAATLLYPQYSREWYLEIDKCPAMKRQQAIFWAKMGSSKGW